VERYLKRWLGPLPNAASCRRHSRRISLAGRNCLSAHRACFAGEALAGRH
jgi:hypothetical protein